MKWFLGQPKAPKEPFHAPPHQKKVSKNLNMSSSSTAPEKKVAQDQLDLFLSWGIWVLFHGIGAIILPFIFERYTRVALVLAAYVLFTLVTPAVRNYVQHAKLFAHLPAHKRAEIENRLVSLLFNLSTSIPSYVGYYELWTSQLPDFATLMRGRVWMMDAFAAWSFGYIVYDFHTLKKTFGADAVIIQLHHVAEMVIVYVYTTEPEGALYLLGGGLMQLSSGALHIQRVLSMANYDMGPNGRVIYKWFLTFVWGWARLVSFPYVQYLCFFTHPLTYLHLFCFATGLVLNVMNAFWLWKIFRQKSLAFGAQTDK